MATKGMTTYTHQGEDYTINDPNIAPEFSTMADYVIGDCVNYQGNLYRFKKTHSAGSWNANHADMIQVGSEMKAADGRMRDFGHEDDELLIDVMEGNYHRQFLKVAERKAGYYARQSKNAGSSDSASVFDPIRIIKGQAYTFYHVYGYFSTIFYDNGTVKSISDETWAASDYRLASAPDNGWAYVTVADTNLETAAVVGGTNNYNGEGYYEGFKDFQFPKMQIPGFSNLTTEVSNIKNENRNEKQQQIIDGIIVKNYIDIGIQLLADATAISGKYWNVTSGNGIGTASSENTKAFAPVQIRAGETYTFIDVYPYFTIITDLDGTVVERLSTDSGPTKATSVYSPAADGYVYVTKHTQVSANTMMIKGIVKPDAYIEGIYGEKKLADDVAVIAESCKDFLKFKYQHLFLSKSTEHRYWNGSTGNAAAMGGDSETNTRAYEPVRIRAGETYRFVNVYAYFTIITEANYKVVTRLSNDVDSNPKTVNYTATADGYALVTKHTNYSVDTMMVDGTETPAAYVEGAFNIEFTKPKGSVNGIDITVKTDGTGDYTSVVEAVNYANAQTGDYPINIYIYSGDYDILEELGGDDFISTIEDSTSERQGLSLIRNNINLIGVGYVVLRFEMPDTVTETQSERVSCLNLREFSNEVKNMTLIAKNCRYTVHDEAQGVGNIVRRCENLRCIHKGNAEGLWPWTTVWGGGTAKSGSYTFLDCQFLTSVYHQAWSYHSNNNTEALFFNVDGCVGSVKDSEDTKYSFRLSYYGTGRTGIETGNIKNCSGHGSCVVQAESGSTGNNIEMYVNGWEDISEIPVTGDE